MSGAPYFSARRSPLPRPSPKQTVLAQWRGFNWSADETARQTTGKKAADVMPGVLQNLRMNRRQAEAEVVKVWNHQLDPAITAHAQPVQIHRGTVFVNVDSSVWLDEIVRYRRKEILERLQNSFGRELIRKISFRLG
jgi:hypothetical protein